MRTVLTKSCDYLAVQRRAGVSSHPSFCRAQGASDTSENKCADIQKVNSCLQQDQFPWELCASAIYCEPRLCVCVAVILYCAVEYFNKSAFHKKKTLTNMGE